MELSSFSENVVREQFKRSGELVELQINIDVFTPEYLEEVEIRLDQINLKASTTKPKGRKREPPESQLKAEKRMLELEREALAEMLSCPIKLPDGSTTCLLKGWDLTENGLPLAADKAVLIRLPPRLVRELWEFCREKANTVKKQQTAGTEQNETISETTEGGYSGLRAVGHHT